MARVAEGAASGHHLRVAELEVLLAKEVELRQGFEAGEQRARTDLSEVQRCR